MKVLIDKSYDYTRLAAPESQTFLKSNGIKSIVTFVLVLPWPGSLVKINYILTYYMLPGKLLSAGHQRFGDVVSPNR